jgi:hypothetical protein
MPGVSSHIFVDETKRRGYLLVASAVVPGDLDTTRRMLRGLVLPGQRRLHMKDKSNSRKRSIATVLAVSGVTATIYDAGRRHQDERERRAACLTALVVDAAARDDSMLVLEQDDTLVVSDRRLLYRATREAGCPSLCATSIDGQPLNNSSRYPTRSPGAGRKAATGDGASSPSSPTCAKSERVRTSAKPERHGRPAGSRAHFPQLVPRTTSSVKHHSLRRHLYETQPAA